MADNTYYYTQALCNSCRLRATARAIARDGVVMLEKFCPEHGLTYDLLSSDVAWFEESLSYVKPRQEPKKLSVNEYKGCPESCGFCPEHQQHVCLPVIEITSSCDLACPICLKGFTEDFDLTSREFEFILDNLIMSEENIDVVNISGGEPTLHPDFPGFLRLCSEKKVNQVTVSTNGLSLLKDKALRDLFKELGIIAAIQFDGFTAETYIELRGSDLNGQKLELINILETEGINYSLVATIAKGVNEHEIPALVDFLFAGKALSLMFQPLCLTGAASENFDLSRRITIPDVINRLSQSPYVKKDDFKPLPCSHYSCFALSYYLDAGDGKFYSLVDFLGKDKFLDVISNKTLPGLDYEGLEVMKERMFELWSAADSNNLSENVLNRIRRTLRELSSCGFERRKSLELGMQNMKAIFIHHFMDAYNFEFGRVIKCCNPYPQKDGKMIPICAMNALIS